MNKPAAKSNELPQYVGYTEIAQATGMDKRQLQRLMTRGKFPKPDALPTKENRWRLAVVADWLEQRNAEQIAALGDLAVTDPAKLKPEQLEDAIANVGARLASLAGHDVEPEDITGITFRPTDEQLGALIKRRENLINRLVSGEPLSKLMNPTIPDAPCTDPTNPKR